MPQPYEFGDEYVPLPCVVHPTRTMEYPTWDLPPGLSERVGEWSDELEKATDISY
ncbi:hypothetical protein ACWGDE_06560 [Streptomyces sp. NPDC054956]